MSRTPDKDIRTRLGIASGVPSSGVLTLAREFTREFLSKQRPRLLMEDRRVEPAVCGPTHRRIPVGCIGSRKSPGPRLISAEMESGVEIAAVAGSGDWSRLKRGTVVLEEKTLDRFVESNQCDSFVTGELIGGIDLPGTAGIIFHGDNATARLFEYL